MLDDNIESIEHIQNIDMLSDRQSFDEHVSQCSWVGLNSIEYCVECACVYVGDVFDTLMI